ncbi:hypothetical protein [Antarctobacter jejuensis]|uniref:hypothetical protein n=1 Tax=Antarctobacter jejuensis TaxID=1439938 RepID=UPI003FD56B23
MDTRLAQAAFGELRDLKGYIKRYDEIDVSNYRERWHAAKKIAGSLYLFTVTQGKQVSYLKLIGISESVRLPNLLSVPEKFKEIPLISVQVPSGTEPHAANRANMVGSLKACVSLSDWLKRNVYIYGDEVLKCRKLLVTIRNKEGIGHFDAQITDIGYKAFFDEGHPRLKWCQTMGGGIALVLGEVKFHFVDKIPRSGAIAPHVLPPYRPIQGAVDATIRSLAEEFIKGCEQMIISTISHSL